MGSAVVFCKQRSKQSFREFLNKFWLEEKS